MPHFYIHIDNGNGFTRDDEGADLSSVDAARDAAVHAGADIIADELKAGCSTVNLTLFIEDTDHRELLKIPMSASVAT